MVIKRQTDLSGNVVLFCRFLRQNGFSLSSSEQADTLQSLLYIPLKSEKTYKEILRATLAKNRYQFEHFFDLYDDYKYELNKAVDSKTKSHANNDKKKDKTKDVAFHALKNWLYGVTPKDDISMAAYNNIEVLSRKQFSAMNETEIELILYLLQKLAKRLAHRKGRLKKISKQRKSFDIRRTMRNNLRMNTDIIQWIYSQPKNKRMNLVILSDVSKSMDLYSKFFIQMIYAFQTSYDKIRTFVFSTALHEVSDLLANHEYDKAFEMISDRIPQWSGGTKIGYCFNDFYERFGSRILNRKTIVMILSDGWDTGESEVFKESMHRIHKRARKVIWLNPLAGNPDFSPSVIGMQNALPFIDKFAPAHNLESLKKAITKL